MFQFGNSQDLVSECHQMLCLFFQYVKKFFFLFRHFIQLATAENTGSHQDRTERCFHIVDHGIGEIFPYPGDLVLSLDDINLLPNADRKDD